MSLSSEELVSSLCFQIGKFNLHRYNLGLACKSLKSLNLGQNFRISDDAVPALLLLQDLTSLNLTHSRITSEGVSRLGRLRNLTTLALKGCKVSHAAVERLQRECPKLSEVAYGCTDGSVALQ